ncbi:hypothetical protein IKE96_01580 [bacterium]|nr:hypothetical protein [bacterium]
MKQRFKKLLLTSGALILGIGIIIVPFCIFSISNNPNEFVFGNFQSYMSDQVKNELSKKYKIN